MDGLWSQYMNASEDTLGPDFNPFPENTDVGTQPLEVEEVPETQFNSKPPVPMKQHPKWNPIGKKLGNFTVDEDKVLVSSWLNVSTDPIVITSQKAEAYWKRITDGYNALRGAHPERTQKSLNKRWDSIKENVSLFSGFYQQVLNRNQSGRTDNDKVVHTRAVSFSLLGIFLPTMNC